MKKKATSDFEKDLYKLMNDSVFEKTMENLRKRVVIKLVRTHDEIKTKKLIIKPSFARQVIFDNDLVGYHMFKDKIVFNEYLGHKQDINVRVFLYGGDISLQYTDTDSLLFEVRTPDFYQDMAKQTNLYDTIDFPKDHNLHSLKNKKK